MRCPKCGYISFDHVEVCLKCNKDVSKAAAQVVGTTYNVAPPSFLRFQPNEDIEVGGDTEIRFENGQEDFDVVDPDLNILVDSEDDDAGDEGMPFDDEFGGLDDSVEDEGFEVMVDGVDDEDGDDDDLGIDLGQFEDAFEGEDSSEGETPLDIPDELSDISDLSAPAAKDDVAAFSFDEPEDSPVVGTAAEDDLDDFNLDLESFGNDFSLSSPEEKELQDDDEGLGSLSLDDIGIVDSKEKPAKKRVDSMDMDADLDFDLDLDGISLTDD